MTARDVTLAPAWFRQWWHQEARHGETSSEAYTSILAILFSAPDSVRQELVALLNPWRPIETAPKEDEEPIILFWSGYRAMEGFWLGHRWYAAGPMTPPREPTHWLPLPAPPKEDKA